jgi:hypothetical protein
MWKHVMSLVTIQWKCVLNTKQESKLTIELKIRIVQYIENFDVTFFLSWIACVWAWTKQVMFNSLCIHYVKVAIEKISGPKKESYSQCSCYVLFFWLKKCFDMFWSVDYVWYITSLLYSTSHMVSTHLWTFKKWHGYSSFQREETNLNIWNLHICQIT